ncbi:GNAT family N-acetyltransferase [Pinisolibacter sp.]|uniref:GNAT family N-acetyltransferase n=1 Tax=Pinisolibacter sp. TaxID=2172024 RepID=UPI002FDEEB9D
MTVAIRSARPGEAGLVLSFVKALAAYEDLSHAVAATEAALDRALFGPAPRVFCDLAEVDGVAVGFALWFHSYSTFQGAAGIYIEDLFVLPEARGHGVGKALVVHLARRCRDEGLGRLHWAVLDWNAPAIAFYRSLGAVMRDEWRAMGLTGAALEKLGGGR